MLVPPLEPGHEPSADLVGPLLQDLPPVVGLLLGALAAICIGCAVIMALGSLLATTLVLGVRTLGRACARYLRRRRPAASAEHHTHEDQASVADLDRYRHDRHSTPDTAANRPDEPA
ncbi:hypothetical protein [Saccharopolyspora sp. SCSIO 74807]|uniref:hypothetical protein n=1 Tax=Saccharopolyspora sp. SCSIO 74807 TaxID=3118084 RepID=UPI0030D52D99